MDLEEYITRKLYKPNLYMLNNKVYIEEIGAKRHEIYRIVYSDDLTIIKIFENIDDIIKIKNVLIDDETNIIKKAIDKYGIYFPDIILHRPVGVKYDLSIDVPTKKSYELFLNIMGIRVIAEEIISRLSYQDILNLTSANRILNHNVLYTIGQNMNHNKILNILMYGGEKARHMLQYIDYHDRVIYKMLERLDGSQSSIIERYGGIISQLYNEYHLNESETFLINILHDSNINKKNVLPLIKPLIIYTVKTMQLSGLRSKDKMFIYFRTVIELGYSDLYYELIPYIPKSVIRKLKTAKTADYLLTNRYATVAMTFVRMKLFCPFRYKGLITLLITIGHYYSIIQILDELIVDPRFVHSQSELQINQLKSSLEQIYKIIDFRKFLEDIKFRISNKKQNREARKVIKYIDNLIIMRA